jgi:tetratricopeptide (TPR) repeat protein
LNNGFSAAFDFRSFPMGPALRKYLGVSDGYRGELAGKVPHEAVEAFARALIDHASDHPLVDGAQLVDILEELVTMDVPVAALQLYEAHREIFPAADFRAQFHLGNAAMLAGSLVLAEQAFSEAQRLVPAETAPYVNMAQLLAYDARFDEARRWIDSGLDVDPNHFGLWELLAWTLRQQEVPGHAKTVEQIARQKNSWAGLSLAMDLVAPDEPERKLNVLEDFYAAGTTSEGFLVEYTAVLGQCGLYDRIPAAIWRADVAVPGKPLSWKLKLHLAQAQLAANRFADARGSLEDLSGMDGLPPQVRDGILPALFAELEESQATPVRSES